MYLGLDLGTSGLKGVLVDGDQSVVAQATAPLTVSRPAPGWSEQNPSEWLTAAELVLSDLAQTTSLADVRGIGLSGQMHGATLLDGSEPTSPGTGTPAPACCCPKTICGFG